VIITLKDKLYLCCPFAPGMGTFVNNLDYYAQKAEWIQANTMVEASRIYKNRHPDIKLPESLYVRIMAERDVKERGVKDGYTGHVECLRIMLRYISENNISVSS